MHADELRSAISRVVEVLNKADILTVVKEYRTARGDSRAVAAARLGHSGAIIMENMDKFSPAEKAVVRCMFLDSLGTTQYWQDLLGSAVDPEKNAADLVHLFSRAMFASTHLPNLVNLLGETKRQANTDSPSPIAGEARLIIRLTDAGERASDPDRIARSIDGIDMLYSACASIARKPAMDLRLDRISGGVVRDVAFMGERDSIAAVSAVIGSIPDALEEIHPDDDLDLDALVASLPIFQDLNTLASLGTFTQNDLKDISETMHQGGMLVLESGVILVNESGATAVAATTTADISTEDSAIQMRPGASTPQQFGGSAATTEAHLRNEAQLHNGAAEPGAGAVERDEHYERYLREREAMKRAGAAGSDDISHVGSSTHGIKPNGVSSNGVNPNGVNATSDNPLNDTAPNDAQPSDDAVVDYLLRKLGRPHRDR